MLFGSHPPEYRRGSLVTGSHPSVIRSARFVCLQLPTPLFIPVSVADVDDDVALLLEALLCVYVGSLRPADFWVWGNLSKHCSCIGLSRVCVLGAFVAQCGAPDAKGGHVRMGPSLALLLWDEDCCQLALCLSPFSYILLSPSSFSHFLLSSSSCLYFLVFLCISHFLLSLFVSFFSGFPSSFVIFSFLLRRLSFSLVSLFLFRFSLSLVTLLVSHLLFFPSSLLLRLSFSLVSLFVSLGVCCLHFSLTFCLAFLPLSCLIFSYLSHCHVPHCHLPLSLLRLSF